MNREGKLRKIAWVTLVLVYLVIIAGAVVRMTGSGMGCPDWPKCFGQWIPPTDEAQLPADYRKDFAEGRVEKIERFANLLENLGFRTDANTIREDSDLRQEEAPFNVFKTWTEYGNRLLGFLSGNAMLLQLVLAFLWFRKTKRRILWYALLNGVLIVFQAWFGSIVVATNLTPWVISIHMFLALVIVAFQIFIIRALSAKVAVKIPAISRLKIFVLASVFISLIQIYFGTQLRQEVDVLLHFTERPDLIEALSRNFEWHRTLAWLVILANGLVCIFLYKAQVFPRLWKGIICIVVLEALVGIVLTYAGFPAWSQPVHLTLATILFGCQISLLSRISMGNHEPPQT